MSPQPVEPLKKEIVLRPHIPLPRYLLDALKQRGNELGLKPHGAAVQAIEAWLDSTKDKVIFPSK